MNKSKSFLNILNQIDQQFLTNNMMKREYHKGEIIFSPCDKCTSLSIVLAGQIKLCKYSSQGKEQIISFINTGEVFGEALVFNNENYPVFVIAETNCTIGMLNKQAILEATLKSKDFTRLFFEELSKKIMILNNKVELLYYSNIKQRLAFYLLKLSKEQGSNIIDLPFTKQKIANILGTSREVISRNISEMEEENYIQIKGKSVILDIESLSMLLES